MIKIIDFSKFSSIKIGEKLPVLIVNNKQDLSNFNVIGACNNILISPNISNLAILGENFDYIKINDFIEIGGSTKNKKIYNFAKTNNLSGFEFLKNIPGTLGGLIKMNAGLCGKSISDNLEFVEFFNDIKNVKEFNFSYRYSGIKDCIFGAKFKLKRGFDFELDKMYEEKRKNQPKGASFGSCFVNPDGEFAGRLLQEVGLKGYAIGGAKFSEKHANFLINFNNASFNDAISLLNLAEHLVKEKFGIILKKEVCIL